MQVRQCTICGKSFEAQTRAAKYCSRACKTKAYATAHRIDMICLHCGKHFMGRPDIGGLYCSKACAAAHTKTVKVLTCVDCGKQFEFYGRTRKLRCDECWHKHRSATNMALRAAKNSNVRLGVGSGHAQSVLDKSADPEHASALERRRAKYAEQKASGKLVSTRDYRYVLTGSDSCELCGYRLFQDALVVHHKDMDRTNNKPDNLAVLCANCHAVLHKAIRRLLARKEPIADLWTASVAEYAKMPRTSDCLEACRRTGSGSTAASRAS